MIYPISRMLIVPFYKLWLRKAEGIENIPKPPFIIAANHSSYYDTLLPHCIIIPILDKKVHALVNSSYWNYGFARFFLKLGECIPVYVKNESAAAKKNQQAMELAHKFLNKGDIVLIFPEGKRSHDGKLNKAYNGIARLALKAKVPVLPFGIIGSNKVMQKGRTIPKFKRCEVCIGKPLYFDSHYGKKQNEKLLEEITRKIMTSIASLIGQKYNH